MTVLVGSHERYLEHMAGRHHPERPERLSAVADGLLASPARDAAVFFSPRAATTAELALVHPDDHVERLRAVAAGGGGRLDPDTAMSPGSWSAALHAAGAGLDAVDRLDAGQADAAFLAVRPPGHHASSGRAMGFCLFNNVAVTAASLAERGERVLIVDWDAHHGNGTQDVFYADPRVLYLSMHQHPLYPGTGRLDETGSGAGEGATVNLPLPAGSRGDVYRAAIDQVVVPVAEDFAPTWVIVSAGFDAHRRDPLTDMGLSAGDYADLTSRVVEIVPAGRRLVFLEGGYDLEALRDSTNACFSALAGMSVRPEPATGDAADAGFAALAAARAVLHR